MKMIRTSKMGRCGGAFAHAVYACPQNAPERVLTHPLASKYPPPLFASDAIAGFYAAFPGRRGCGPYPYSARFRTEPRRIAFLFYPLLNKEVLQERLGCSCGKFK